MSKQSTMIADWQNTEYTARDIEILEGLEPVRRRPGMYVGGTDDRALHHLFAEILDNAMDEAISGHANRIDIALDGEGYCQVRDNGRGIPIDPHPKFPDRSALEIIMTTLHAGGKFSGSAYRNAGGLHGVGAAVVNALSEHMLVEVIRERHTYRQEFRRGKAVGALTMIGAAPNRRGSNIRFRPDPQIFGDLQLSAPRMEQMARAKAYLHRGVTINWSCSAPGAEAVASFCYPNGLASMIGELARERNLVGPGMFCGREEDGTAICEWAICWSANGFGNSDNMMRSYCNAVPTPEGGTHENGMKKALIRALKAHALRSGNKKAERITADDICASACILLSVFVPEPEFVGQTKDRLVSLAAARLVEKSLGDHLDHWLANDPARADDLLDWIIARTDERLKNRRDREIARNKAGRRLRLPGKLADCSCQRAEGTELFIVEGDSAGGSAKQARDRTCQAILPLRGKILNVASAGAEKLAANQELRDLTQALGCGLGTSFRLEDLRYERIIIMTDADIDGAHIAALLITFFFRQTPGLIEAGKLFLAQPPLYKISSGSLSCFASDDADKEKLLKTMFKGKKKIEISRFKGLGEMMSAQLKTTTMAKETRSLARISLSSGHERAEQLLNTLMGKKPEPRFRYIQDNACFNKHIDI